MTIPSNCYEYVELLDAYLDDELAADEKAGVDLHLASCPACVREFDRIKRLQNGLKTLPRLAPSRDIDFSFLEDSKAQSSVLMPQAASSGVIESECASNLPLLDAYYDLELAADEKKLVEKHLATCASCSDHLAQIPRLVMGLKILPRLAPSRDIVESIDFSALALPAVKANVCADVLGLLDAYHDNELSAVERVSVASHLEGCAECAEILRQIAKLVDTLKCLPRVRPQRDIVGEISFDEAAQSSRSNLVPLKRKLRFGFVAAAAAVALIFAFNIKSPTVPGKQIALNASTGGRVPSAGSGIASENAKSADHVSSNQKPELALLAENSETTQEQVESKSAKNLRPSTNNTGLASKQILASRPDAEPETASVPHEALPNDVVRNTDNANEMAVLPDSANSAGAGADALGIGTDEDGLYDIKI